MSTATTHQPLTIGATVVRTGSSETCEFVVTKSGPSMTTIKRQDGQYADVRRIPTAWLRGEGWQAEPWSVR